MHVWVGCETRESWPFKIKLNFGLKWNFLAEWSDFVKNGVLALLVWNNSGDGEYKNCNYNFLIAALSTVKFYLYLTVILTSFYFWHFSKFYDW